MKIRFLVFCFVFCIYNFTTAQNREIIGIIADTTGVPLENASVMALPNNKDASLKFAIADNKGRYKLQLDALFTYKLEVSYIGFKDAIYTIKPYDNIKEYNFRLITSTESLKEIVIKYDVKPVVVKEDTLVFNVKNFTNGNERKLRDQLEKLPGIVVNKNGNVFVQGKLVTTFMVENKPFFGGGSKLGVENIPADAVDKVEVLDHFNEVGFMKKVSNSKQLAMNIKLKKDKKKFTFGDIEASSGPENFYKLHTGLFNYQPNTNMCFIGDLNNFGSSTLNYEDFSRFENNTSEYLVSKRQRSSLFAFQFDKTNILKNKTQFAAYNFSTQITQKTEFSGYVVFSKLFNERKNSNNIQYIQNTTISKENRENTANQKSSFGSVNFKINYAPNKTERLKYNANFQFSGNSDDNLLISQTIANNTSFKTLNKNDDVFFKQFIEWNKELKANNTTTLVVNHNFNKSVLNNNWLSNNKFLIGLIPLETDGIYTVNQTGNLKTNSLDALFKYYWIFNNYNHIYAIIGNDFETTNFQKFEKQIKTSGQENNFDGFGNNLQYSFNNAFSGIEYKFIIGKLSSKASLYFHLYDNKTNNFDLKNTFKKHFIEPKFESEYKFSNAHILSLNYDLSNQFPEFNRFASRFNLQTYNSIYKGNQKLKNEQFHNLSFYYKKNDPFHGLAMDAFFNYVAKTKTIRDELIIVGINQFVSPLSTNNPENNYNLSSNITKNIWEFELGFKTNLFWSDYKQNINNTLSLVKQNSQDLGFALKTKNVKWPFVTLEYNKIFNTFSGLTSFKFYTDKFGTKLEYEFSDNLIFETDYSFQKNSDNITSPTYVQIANAKLEFKQKNNPWNFQLSATNFLNSGIIINNSFSDYFVSNRTTFILPRIVMLTVFYKL